MKNNKPIQITIPSPCSQNWDEMQPVAGGRFCDHCQTKVIDFTTWSDASLHDFFRKNKSVCGHFHPSQLKRPISLPYQPNSQLYRITIAMGLTLIFTQTPHLLAQSRPPKIEQKIIQNLPDSTYYDNSEIKGQVLDEKKEPLISAFVQVFQNGILKGSTVTDYDGNYVIKPLEPGMYKLLGSFKGYDTVMVDTVIVTKNATVVNLNMQLEKGQSTYEININKKRKLIHEGENLEYTGEIMHMFTGHVEDVVSTTVGVYSAPKQTIQIENKKERKWFWNRKIKSKDH